MVKLTSFGPLLFLFLALTQQACSSMRHRIDPAANSSFISSIRTDTLYERCLVPRAPFMGSQHNESESIGRRQTGATLKVNGDQLIYNLLNKNESGAKYQVNKSMGSIVFYLFFIAIGLLATIVAAFVLICCCKLSEKCPPCLVCRYPEDHVYTNCQKKWPAILIIVLALAIIGTMIAVLVINPKLQKGYSETRCSVAMFFDDTLYGNYTKDGQSYFIGLKPLNKNLIQIQQKLQASLNKIANLSVADIVSALADTIGIKHQSSNILKYGGSTEPMHFTYVSPTNTSLSSNQHIKSSSVNSAINFQHSLMLVSDIGQMISNSLPKLSQKMQTGLQKYESIVNQVEEMDKQTDQKFTTYQKGIVTPVSIIIYILASIAIVFCIASIVATVLICFKDSNKCVNLLYSACAVLTLIGIVFFIFAVGMSALVGGTHYGCSYIEVGLKNKSQFAYRFGPLFQNQLLTNMVAQCATKQGKGILINPITINDALKSLNSTSNHLHYLYSNHLSHIPSPQRHKIGQSLGAQIGGEKQDVGQYLYHLQLNLSSLTDQSQNLSTKIDCQVLGEDIQLIMNTFCTQIFNYSFSMRVLSIIVGFLILAFICMTTFYAVRVQKYQKQDNHKQSGKYHEYIQENNGDNSKEPQQLF